MNRKTSLVSIAMTTYNGEKFLAQQLDSIVLQSYQNIEVVICDDGSTDNTLNIIQSYCNKYHFITLYQNSHKLGFVKNFEKAISLCKGGYIALSDQDDIWEKDKLKIQMDEMHKLEQNTSVLPIMIHSDLSMINEENQQTQISYFKFKHYKLKKDKDLGAILGPCGVMGNTILMNRHLKNKILPFPDELDVHDYWIALINELFGKRVTLVRPLVKYRIHSQNTSNSTGKLKISFNKLIKQIVSFDLPMPYMTTHRKFFLPKLLQNKVISDQDKIIIQVFLDYLNLNGSFCKIFCSLLKYDLIKRNYIFRSLFFIQLFITKIKRQINE